MLSRQIAPLLRKFCKVSAHFTIARQRSHALAMLRSFKVILSFSNSCHVAHADLFPSSSTSAVSPISHRHSVTLLPVAWHILIGRRSRTCLPRDILAIS